MNIITIFLGVTVGATATGEVFLSPSTLLIIVLGLFAFACGTAGGVLFGKLMYKVTGGKVNPLIGSAGVSAVPMAARVSQKVGQAENPSNFLLMRYGLTWPASLVPLLPPVFCWRSANLSSGYFLKMARTHQRPGFY